jgi:hypothetical protein
MVRDAMSGRVNAMPQPPRRPLNHEPLLYDPTRPALLTPMAMPMSSRPKPPEPTIRTCGWCQRVRIWLRLGPRPVRF